MRFAEVSDIASVPVPFSVTAPLSTISVKFPALFWAIVPLLVIVPINIIALVFSSVSVLPLLIVGLLVVPSSVALPLF